MYLAPYREVHNEPRMWVGKTTTKNFNFFLKDSLFIKRTALRLRQTETLRSGTWWVSEDGGGARGRLQRIIRLESRPRARPSSTGIATATHVAWCDIRHSAVSHQRRGG